MEKINTIAEAESAQKRQALREALWSAKDFLELGTSTYILRRAEDDSIAIEVQRYFDTPGSTPVEFLNKQVSVKIYQDGRISDMEFDLKVTKHRELLRTHRLMIEAHEKLESEVKIIISHIPDWFWSNTSEK